MEPSNTPDYSGSTTETTITKSNLLIICDPLCRVTTFSKILAAVLFICLPFIGAYVGYRVAPAEVIEIGELNSNYCSDEKNSDWNLPAYTTNPYIVNEYGFSFEVPSGWSVTEINSDGQLSVPPEGVKNLLVKKMMIVRA